MEAKLQRCIGDTLLASSQAAIFPGSQNRWQSVTSVCHADKLAPDKIMTKPTCIDVHLGAIRCQWYRFKCEPGPVPVFHQGETIVFYSSSWHDTSLGPHRKNLWCCCIIHDTVDTSIYFPIPRVLAVWQMGQWPDMVKNHRSVPQVLPF